MKWLWFPNKSFKQYSWLIRISGLSMSLALIALISFMVSAFFSRDIAEYSNKTFIAFLGISNLTSLISGLKDKWFVVLSKNRGVALEKIENRFSFLYIMNVLINAALSTGAALYFYWMI